MKILFINILSDPHLDSASLGEESEFTVDYTDSVFIASEKIHVYEYDCIVLCCVLNNTTTQKLLSEIIKSNSNCGLILLLNENSVEHKIQALHAGADDCLSIPYYHEELTARILAIIRRKKFHVRDNIHFANMIIDIGSRSVFVWDTLISLTRTEYELLLYLIMNQSKALSQSQIADYIWGDNTENKEASNLLVTHIKNLRKKLNQAKAEVEIKNIYGIGYKIIEL